MPWFTHSLTNFPCRIALLFVVACAVTRSASAQSPPVVQWERSLGGSNNDDASCLVATADGGFVAAGSTQSFDGDVTGLHSVNADIWVVKLDAGGALLWQKTFGGSSNDYANAIVETGDGGVVVVGSTGSSDGDIAHYHGGTDFWALKIDATGALVWENTYGGSGNDYATGVAAAGDGFVIVGTSYSNDGQVKGNHGSYGDQWIVKINAAGTLQWQRCVGGSLDDEARAVTRTNDGGFVVVGASWSNDGDAHGHHGRGDTTDCSDFFVVKIDSGGALQWTQSLGGFGTDDALAVAASTDGGCVVAGASESNDGNVSGHHGPTWNADYWVVKLDPAGAIEWQRSLGGTNNDRALAVRSTADGAIYAAGYAGSVNGDVTGNHGDNDYWIVRLDGSGVVVWQACYGGTAADGATAFAPSRDGGYAVAGGSTSNNGDVTGHHGNTTTSDYWIVKLRNVAASIYSRPYLTFSVLTCDSARRDTLWIHNFGSKPLVLFSASLSGADAAHFALLPGMQFPDTVPPGDSAAVFLRYTSSSPSYSHATLSIANSDTAAGHDPWIVALTGTMDSAVAQYPGALNVGTVNVGQTRDTVVYIHNTGTIGMCVGAVTVSGPFTIVSPVFPIVVPAGDSVALRFRFSPTADSAYTVAAVMDISCPCPEQRFLTLSGKGYSCFVQPTAAIQLPLVHGYAGDTIRVPVAIAASRNFVACGAKQYQVRIRYNRSLLDPVDRSLPGVDSGRDRIITVSGTRSDTGSTLTTVLFIAALGDSNRTPLHVDSISWLDGSVRSNATDGEFMLDGICVAGGQRLLRAEGSLMLSQNAPNPCSTTTSIVFETIEAGRTRVLVYDMLGRTVAVVCDDVVRPGIYARLFSLAALPAGAYVYVLDTPSMTARRIMTVTK